MRAVPPAPTAHEQRIPVIYILGYGRSGSTIFDIVLRNHEQVIGCGELFQLSSRFLSDLQRCGCRKRTDCPLWTGILEQWRAGMTVSVEEYEQLRKRFDSPYGAFKLLVGSRLGSASVRTYLNETARLYQVIAEHSGKRIIVDSSKSVARALSLTLMPEIAPTFVHLTRDPRGVAWSMQRDAGRACWNTALRWTLRNTFAEMLTGWTNAPSIRVRYEDFSRDPASTLNALQEASGLDLTGLHESVSTQRPMDVGCSIDGNKIRKSDHVVLTPDRASWRSKLTKSSALSVTAVAFPLMRRYRYH